MEDKQIKLLQSPMTHKRKIQTKPKPWKQWIIVAYVESRQVAEKLDQVFWPGNWQDIYKESPIQLSSDQKAIICWIWVLINWNWVYKYDVWVWEWYEILKTTYSDAFKRASVKWGIWRYLYDFDVIFIKEEDYEKYKYKINEYVKFKKWWPLDKKTINKADLEREKKNSIPICKECWVKIDNAKVVKYSMDIHKKVLCYKCQQKDRKEKTDEKF